MSKQPFFYSERHNEKHVTLYIIYDTREDNSAVLQTAVYSKSRRVWQVTITRDFQELSSFRAYLRVYKAPWRIQNTNKLETFDLKF